MNEDVYVLKDAVDKAVLAELNYAGNFKADRFNHAASEHVFTSIDEIRDWTNALESGKQIVNPVSPQEKLNKLMDALFPSDKRLVRQALDIIAEDPKHSEVKGWLREGENGE